MDFGHTGRLAAFLTLLTLVMTSGGCSVDDTAINSPAIKSGDADFSTVVSLGNSLTAGFADGALGEAGQRCSYPALIAKQMQSAFNQPLIKDPGVGIDFQGNPAGRMQLISLSPLTLTSLPLNGPPQVISPPPYNNFAVPGANTGDLLNTTSGDLEDLILQGRGTQIHQAKAAHPTFIIAWIGANDVLGAALLGRAIDGVTLTPTVDFSRNYAAIIDSLALTGAKIIVANVPDVTQIPFVTTARPYVVNPLTQEPLKDQQGNAIPLLGTFSDGSSGPLSNDPRSDRYAHVTILGSLLTALGAGIPTGVLNGTGSPLPDQAIIDKAEITKIRTRVAEFNSVIMAATTARSIPVVNMQVLLDQIYANGVQIGGIHLTTEFITGGIFSLDAVHLSPIGNGITANAFIQRINEFYRSTIPEVNLAELLQHGGLAKSLASGQRVNPALLPRGMIEGMIKTTTGRTAI